MSAKGHLPRQQGSLLGKSDAVQSGGRLDGSETCMLAGGLNYMPPCVSFFLLLFFFFIKFGPIVWTNGSDKNKHWLGVCIKKKTIAEEKSHLRDT